MQDLSINNMDVAVGLKPKTGNSVFSPAETNSSDTLPPSFRHPSERVMDSIQRFFQGNNTTADYGIHANNLAAGIYRYSNLPEENIFIFSDTDQPAGQIIKTLTAPGDTVLVCQPIDDNTFPEESSNDIDIQYFDSTTPLMADPEGIINAVTAKTRVIYLANPNLCTGTIYGIDEIETIIDTTNNVKIILDETYYEYYGTSLAGLIRQYDNITVIRSFSAAFGLDELPCSYILASPENIASIKHTYTEDNISPLSMVAAAAVLTDHEYLKSRILTVKENMTYLAIRLRGIGIPVLTTPADFLLAEVANPVQVISELRSTGIEVRKIDNDNQLQNYISIPIIDDNYSTNIIETFMHMPRQLYVHKPTGPKLILHRSEEHQIEPVNSDETVEV